MITGSNFQSGALIQRKHAIGQLDILQYDPTLPSVKPCPRQGAVTCKQEPRDFSKWFPATVTQQRKPNNKAPLSNSVVCFSRFFVSYSPGHERAAWPSRGEYPFFPGGGRLRKRGGEVRVLAEGLRGAAGPGAAGRGALALAAAPPGAASGAPGAALGAAGASGPGVKGRSRGGGWRLVSFWGIEIGWVLALVEWLVSVLVDAFGRRT